MVNHNWIETKLIQFERAKNRDTWTQQKEKQLKYLLELYHTGKFYQMSTHHITQTLQKLASNRIGK
jgi:hypothetical protein